MKVRVILKAKKDWGSIEVGETMVLYNDIFDLKNGIAFFPIDYKQWDVISYSQYTGIKDYQENEIYCDDYVEAFVNRKQGINSKVWGRVCFDEGCFSIDISKIEKKDCGYDVRQKIALFDFISIKIIDNKK